MGESLKWCGGGVSDAAEGWVGVDCELYGEMEGSSADCAPAARPTGEEGEVYSDVACLAFGSAERERREMVRGCSLPSFASTAFASLAPFALVCAVDSTPGFSLAAFASTSSASRGGLFSLPVSRRSKTSSSSWFFASSDKLAWSTSSIASCSLLPTFRERSKSLSPEIRSVNSRLITPSVKCRLPGLRRAKRGMVRRF